MSLLNKVFMPTFVGSSVLPPLLPHFVTSNGLATVFSNNTDTRHNNHDGLDFLHS